MIKNWHKMTSDTEFTTLGAMSTVLKPLLFLLHKGYITLEAVYHRK